MVPGPLDPLPGTVFSSEIFLLRSRGPKAAPEVERNETVLDVFKALEVWVVCSSSSSPFEPVPDRGAFASPPPIAGLPLPPAQEYVSLQILTPPPCIAPFSLLQEAQEFIGRTSCGINRPMPAQCGPKPKRHGYVHPQYHYVAACWSTT